MLENIPETFIGMRNKEFRVLVAIENMMKFHEWVPVEEIVNFTGYNLKEIEFIISHLAQKKL
ncbi:MAG: serine/threonine protein kinase, partial [Candidatus Methanoperedens sp.]|nr:serine/threonine protein kinase [Candidatus Methanoperedens sp.]